MYGKLSLAAAKEGGYDLVVRYQRHETEFALDFLAGEHAEKTKETIADYLARCGQGLKVRQVRIMAGAAVLAVIPLALLVPDKAHPEEDAPSSPAGGEQAEQPLEAALMPLLRLSAGGEITGEPPVEGVVHDTVLLRGRLESLDSAEAAVSAAGQVAGYLADNRLQRLHADLEGHGAFYAHLLKELRRRLPHCQISFTASYLVEGLSPANIPALLQYADFLVLDTVPPSSLPGPASPAAMVEEALQALLEVAPGEQVVLASPGYGRLWDDAGRYSGEALPLREADRLLDNSDPIFIYDSQLQAPNAIFLLEKPFLLEDGEQLPAGKYQLWFENSRSEQARSRLVEQYGLRDTMLWPVPAQQPGGAVEQAISFPADELRQTATVTAPTALLHRQPQRQPGEIAALQLGAVVTVLEQAEDGWLRVQLQGGVEGYLPAEDVQLHQIAVVTPAAGTYVLAQPWGGSEMIATLPCKTPLTILDEYDSGWCKVMLADRRTGYLHGHQLGRTSLDTPIVIRTSATALRLRALPAEESDSFGVVPAGEQLLVLDEQHPDYAKISYGDTVAYVTASYLQ